MIERNKKIKKLRFERHLTYFSISKLYPNLSIERIRQICNDIKLPYCKIHKRVLSSKKCELCNIEKNYHKLLRNKDDVMKEIQKLRKPDRSKETVAKKRILVKRLRKAHFSVNTIAKLLDKDRTTILNLLSEK